MKYFRLVGTTDDEYTILEADDEYKFGELYYHYIHEEDIEIYTTLDDNDERIEFIIGAGGDNIEPTIRKMELDGMQFHEILKALKM